MRRAAELIRWGGTGVRDGGSDGNFPPVRGREPALLEHPDRAEIVFCDVGMQGARSYVIQEAQERACSGREAP